LPVFSYKGKTPRIHEDALVSPLATVIGNVEISEGTAVFPGAVIRGDVAKITVGRYSNIQDNVVLHGGDIYEGDNLKGHLPVEIGDYVTVGHGAVVHGSRIEDVSMIGIRAIVYGGSVVGAGSIVGMNATVLENTRIPKRSVVVGVPAKVIKAVDDVTYSRIKKHALWYHKLAKSHKGTIF
jgi:carbonic anhydrase/acetyltransferase-like protein (isoleucine patch superfamily)